MKKKVTIAYTLTLFPITGLFGVQYFYLGNFGKAFLRMFTVSGLGILWIYDLVNMKNIVEKVNLKYEERVTQLISLFDSGKLGEAIKILIKSGETNVYVTEIIQRGRGDVIIQNFAKSEEEEKILNELMVEGDVKDIVTFLSAFYAKNQMSNLFKTFSN